jgi:Methyltransferase domain
VKSFLRNLVYRSARYVGRPVYEKLNSKYGARMDRLSLDVETAIELISVQNRRTSALYDRLEPLLDAENDRGAESFVGKQLDDMTGGCAALVGYAESHLGFAGQAGLWFNPPVALDYAPGAVSVGGVNERIVETPYVMGAIASRDRACRVLDCGAAESTVALSLASLGYETVALDSRPYPFRHPKLTCVASPVQEWEGPEKPFDAIVCVSSLEHMGLPAYDQTDVDMALDKTVVALFQKWLAPDGILVLTVPFGSWRVDEFQRTYDDDHIQRVLAGWSILDRRYAFRKAGGAWVPIVRRTYRMPMRREC